MGNSNELESLKPDVSFKDVDWFLSAFGRSGGSAKLLRMLTRHEDLLKKTNEFADTLLKIIDTEIRAPIINKGWEMEYNSTYGKVVWDIADVKKVEEPCKYFKHMHRKAWLRFFNESGHKMLPASVGYHLWRYQDYLLTKESTSRFMNHWETSLVFGGTIVGFPEENLRYFLVLVKDGQSGGWKTDWHTIDQTDRFPGNPVFLAFK